MNAFNTTVELLGALLVVGALVSGLAHRSFLSLTALFVLAGFLLGPAGAGILDFDPRSGFVQQLAIVALIVILFRDGLEVESEMLQTAWHLPLRKLVLAMPITAALIACATRALVGLSWTESFLVGVLLSPTDPVLSSTVVTNPRVPRVIRHSLNLESGMNDGLALPGVLALVAALGADDDFVVWRFVLQDVGLGLAFGVVCGVVASVLMPRARSLARGDIPDHQKSLYALGVAFATYGVTVVEPHGNGFIAVFVCAITLGIRRPDLRVYFEQRATDIVELVKLGVFVVFGAVLTFSILFEDGWAAVGVAALTLLVVRPIAVWLALAGTRTSFATKAFMAWFGPRGVATMTFSLFVLSQGIDAGERIFGIAALTVFCSIIVHGLTDTPGAEWIARRSEEVSPPEPAQVSSGEPTPGPSASAGEGTASR